MRRHTSPAIAALSLLAVWMFAGCSSPSTGDNAANDDLNTREQTINLDDPYGGYNFGDEVPNFGDAMLAADYGPDASLVAGDPFVGDTLSDPADARRFLMITWGNLEADSTIDFPTDWTGGLSVENGYVILRRTIRFDPHDFIVPRTSRTLLEWVSHTQPHFDGVLVELRKIVSTEAAASDEVPALSLTFKTEPLTVTINEEDLADLHRVVKVDEAGNAVAFNTITVMPDACPGGFLAGQWKNVDDRRGGIFRGKWVSENGLHMGYLRGVYGVNSREERVFFGKWITAGGHFRGLLRGTYGAFDTTDEPGGWFRGVWLLRNRSIGGTLGGVWQTSDRVEHCGFFRGKWEARCR